MFFYMGGYDRVLFWLCCEVCDGKQFKFLEAIERLAWNIYRHYVFRARELKYLHELWVSVNFIPCRKAIFNSKCIDNISNILDFEGYFWVTVGL